MTMKALRIVAWIVVGGCCIISVQLCWGVMRLPYLSGSGAAQADLGLFLILMPVIACFTAISFLLLTTTYFIKDRVKGVAGLLRYNNNVCAVALLNNLISLLFVFWLLFVWKK
jgi:hypothetical protein